MDCSRICQNFTWTSMEISIVNFMICPKHNFDWKKNSQIHLKSDDPRVYPFCFEGWVAKEYYAYEKCPEFLFLILRVLLFTKNSHFLSSKVILERRMSLWLAKGQIA